MEDTLGNLKREVAQSLAGASWQNLLKELGEGKAFQDAVEQHACDELDRAFTTSAKNDFNKDDVFQNAVRELLGGDVHISGKLHSPGGLLDPPGPRGPPGPWASGPGGRGYF